MKSKQEKALEKLLRKTERATPTLNFTENVMQQIDAEATQSITLEPQMANLLRRHALNEPSVDFTQHVMAKAVSAKMAYAPIIPPRVWSTIAAFLVLLIGIGQLSSKKPQAATDTFRVVYQSLAGLSHLITAIPITYVLGLSVISTLLMIDYFLRYKLVKIV